LRKPRRGYSTKARRTRIKTNNFIVMALLASVIMLTAAGCGEADKQELSYRNSFKKIWDRTATDVNASNKKIKTAYDNGDIDAVVAEYKALASKYEKSRKEIAGLKTPPAYLKLNKAAQEYMNSGALYFNDIAKVVDETGGNYGETQSAGFKTSEKRLASATAKVESAMKTMRFTLQ
jgi:hypothetical protein